MVYYTLVRWIRRPALQGLIGRRASHPEVLEVRELTLAEVKATPRAPIERIKKLRDSHHAAARLLAMGFKQGDVALEVGYSINGLSMLAQSPAFQELVASYREMITDEWKGNADNYYGTLVSVRMKTLRQISDRLDEAEESGEKLPLNQLSNIHADAADRTGYPKRKESVNLNLDFADRLDAAVRRSREVKQIEAVALPINGSGGVLAQQEGVGKASGPHAPSSLELPADGAGTETGGEPRLAAARPSPTIQSLLPPTRKEKALLRRA